jgi:hypothetical protein
VAYFKAQSPPSPPSRLLNLATQRGASASRYPCFCVHVLVVLHYVAIIIRNVVLSSRWARHGAF